MINVAELLKDCPSGMELDCTVYDNCTFKCILDENCYPIQIQTPEGNMQLSQYGCMSLSKHANCIIFPKGKTTWDGFQRPFKDGDILVNVFGGIVIYKGEMDYNKKLVDYYCGYRSCDNTFIVKENKNSYFGHINDSYYATEEEKQKLFQAIKENGYKWNSETKTLEKLVESPEDTNDKTVMAGIYFDRNNYADEVELHLNNYEIEIRDGKTYAIFKNQENEILKLHFKDGDVCYLKTKNFEYIFIFKVSEDYNYIQKYVNLSGNNLYIDKKAVCPIDNIKEIRFATEEEKQKLFQAIKDNGYKWNEKTKTLEKLLRFKVGDRIKKKGDYISGIITQIDIENFYKVEYCGGVSYINSEYQDDYELLPDKFDINTLVPFESRVLVRDVDHNEWEGAVFGRYDGNMFFTIGGIDWKYCIPYEGNEHLLGKTNDCDEFYKIW